MAKARFDYAEAAKLVEVKDLCEWFPVKRTIADSILKRPVRYVKAVDHVSLDIFEGECLGLVGETGAGKPSTALGILRLLPTPQGKYLGGSILFNDIPLLEIGDAAMRDIRGKCISMIFQDPMTSLNPVFTIERQVSEPFHPSKRWPPSMNEVRGLAALLCQRPRPPRTESIEVDSRTPSTVL